MNKKPTDKSISKNIVISPLNYEMTFIQPGSFMMGSPDHAKALYGYNYDNENRHEVRITKGFYIGVTQVTQAQWKQVMGNTPSLFKSVEETCPVEGVSWDDVREFISKLNRQSGVVSRLPTEAEWEYAAKAETRTPFSFGNSLSTDQANFNGNHPFMGSPLGKYRKRTMPVASFPSNDWGIYDMHGNVWEWCEDWYAAYSADCVEDPASPPSGSYRVLRGGSWGGSAWGCRSAYRGRSQPGTRSRHYGFRLVAHEGMVAKIEKAFKVEPVTQARAKKKEKSDSEHQVHYDAFDINYIKGSCPKQIEIPYINYEMTYIPEGSFKMGSPENEEGRYKNETRHPVSITKPFFIGITAITQSQWECVMGDNPSFFKEDGGNFPVEGVSWYDIKEFIQKLNQTVVGKFRLPTEAEWEYLARAGTDTPFSTGQSLSSGQANYNGLYPTAGFPKGIYREKTTPVKAFPPNRWGLYDMHGNIWEWCEDWYAVYSSSTSVDPAGPVSGLDKILRGGCFNNHARNCRSAHRNRNEPGTRDWYYGFRLVLEPSR